MILIAFAAGILLSQQLWINEGRFFPILVPSDAIPNLSPPFDIIPLLLFIASCALWVFYEKRIVGLITIAGLTVVLLQDQMRWQPWVYLYLLMLLPYLFQSENSGSRRSILTALQWIIAGVYVWSAIHKFNPGFLNGTFFRLINVLGLKASFETWKEVGYMLPIIEFSMGLALLTHRFRKIGMYTAITTHIFILLYFSPVALDQNSIVYPWNAAMIIFILMLFSGGVHDEFRITIREIRSNVLFFIPVVLVWVFPILNFLGYWDHYLSFSLYSDKPSRFYIAIEKNEINRIDKRFANYFAEVKGLEGGQLIEIDKWALSELNVPFYPEVRLFRQLTRNFCELGIENDKIVFLELTYTNKEPHYDTFLCSDLKPE